MLFPFDIFTKQIVVSFAFIDIAHCIKLQITAITYSLVIITTMFTAFKNCRLDGKFDIRVISRMKLSIYLKFFMSQNTCGGQIGKFYTLCSKE